MDINTTLNLRLAIPVSRVFYPLFSRFLVYANVWSLRGACQACSWIDPLDSVIGSLQVSKTCTGRDVGEISMILPPGKVLEAVCSACSAVYANMRLVSDNMLM